METRQQQETEQEKGRKKRTAILLSVIIILVILMEAVFLFRVKWTVTIPSTMLLAFINLNVIILLVLIVLVMRNVTKLTLERRMQIIGARLKTKLVVAFVTFSFIPTLILFILAWSSVSYTMNKWFSLQVEKTLEEALGVAQTYYQSLSDNLLHYSNTIAGEGIPITPKNTAALKRADYKLDALWYFSGRGKLLGSSISNTIQTGTIQPPDKDAVTKAASGPYYSIESQEKGEVIRAYSPIYSEDSRVSGYVVADHYVPRKLVQRMREISTSFEEYRQYQMFRAPIKLGYLLLFLMVALLVVFSATWFSFYLARGLTVPIQELAEGTRRVAEGDLDVRINALTDTELGVLVDSFNSMTEDLKAGKTRLEAAYGDLERRRHYIEIILGSVAAGVISLDKTGRIATINRSAEKLLGMDASAVVGKNYREVLSREQLEMMKGLIRELNASQKDSLQKEVHLTIGERSLTLMTNMMSLKDDDGNYLGLVVVLDDLTQLMKAQRMAAWREVARRIAHEIKNPLTPIRLSAERLQKKFGEKVGDGADVFKECTGTIVKQVEELKVLVNEFSNFAKMPATNPSPNRLNDIAREAFFLFREAHRTISFRLTMDPEIPVLNVDRDQIKRVLINLIDNAVAAVEDKGEITLSTRYDREHQMAVMEVSDDGPGIPAEDRDRLFEPYFSTKKGGTGLGLAIVSTIVADHGGYVRVLDNEPRGMKFVIELPART